jgi:hypothetical protein
VAFAIHGSHRTGLASGQRYAKGKVMMSRQHPSDRLEDIAQIGGIERALRPNGMLGLINVKEKSWQSNQSLQF